MGEVEGIAFIAIICIVGFAVGLSKGGAGAVVVALLTPSLSLIMPVAQAVSLVLPLLILADMFALRIYWREWDNYQVRILLPAAAGGVVIGLFVLNTFSDELLRRSLALVTLLFVVYKLVSDRLKDYQYEHRAWHGYVAGFTSAVTSTIANLGAPPFTAYLIMQKLSPRLFVATTTIVFAIINLIKQTLFILFLENGVTLSDLRSVLWAVPFVPLGVWLGRIFIDWVNPVVFDWLMLIALVVIAVVLLI